MKLSKPAAVVASLAAVFVLSSCTVSAEARNVCENAGGTVESKSFTIRENAGFFEAATSGPLHYCADLSGSISTVYNEKIETLSDSWFLAEYNKETWRNCESLGGETYETRKKSGKSTVARYVCVQDGRVVPLKG